jgi:cupin 2 domain-containing protein
MPPITNLFRDIPTPQPDEVVERLVAGQHCVVERLISYGHASPNNFWYDQERSEWVMLLSGAARLRFEDELIEMRPGDFVNIPAHRRHRVEWASPDEPTVWLAIHYD